MMMGIHIIHDEAPAFQNEHERVVQAKSVYRIQTREHLIWVLFLIEAGNPIPARCDDREEVFCASGTMKDSSDKAVWEKPLPQTHGLLQ